MRYFESVKKLKLERVRNHILFWVAYLFFKTLLNVTAEGEETLVPSLISGDLFLLMMSMQLTFLLVKIPFVYLCFYLLDSYLLRHWKLWIALTAAAILFIIAALMMNVLNHAFILPVLLGHPERGFNVFALSSVLYYSFILLFVGGLASSIRLFRRQYQTQVRALALQKEKTEAELKYLKGQVNPHFLFNTLNNIYSLARTTSPKTPDAVLKLSKLMRFMLYEASHSKIKLADEIKLIEDYISLEKLRYADRLKVTYEVEIDNPDQEIAPLLLIHFVENAFKHGAGESRFEAYISIKIELKKGYLIATIENSKEVRREPESEQKIGMQNIKRQLELLYPNHTLTQTEEPTNFRIELTASLTNTV